MPDSDPGSGGENLPITISRNLQVDGVNSPVPPMAAPNSGNSGMMQNHMQVSVDHTGSFAPQDGDEGGSKKVSVNNNPYSLTNSHYGFADEYDPNLPEPPFYLKLDRALQRFFTACGVFAAQEPGQPGNLLPCLSNAWCLIICSLVVGIGLSMGTMVKEAEERPDRLWIPTNAQALPDSDWIASTWPSTSRMNIALTSCSGGCMLTKDSLHALYQQYYETLQITVDGSPIVSTYYGLKKYAGIAAGAAAFEKYNNKVYVYENAAGIVTKSISDPTVTSDATAIAAGVYSMKCNAPDGVCKKTTVFDLLQVDYTAGKNWFADKTDAWILQKINDRETAGYPLSRVMGGITRDATTNKVTGAEVVSTQWELSSDDFVDDKDSNRRKDPVADRWEHDALCILGTNSFRDRDGIFDISTGCEANKLTGNLETRVSGANKLTGNLETQVSNAGTR